MRIYTLLLKIIQAINSIKNDIKFSNGLSFGGKLTCNGKPLITYKKLEIAYSIPAKTNKNITWTAEQGALSGYNAVGIAYITTGHGAVLVVSGWQVYYSGQGAVNISNYYNSVAVSGTLNVNVLYVSQSLF